MKFQAGKANRKSLALTIYNGFAAVKEVRNVSAEEKIDLLIIEDLPGEIETDSFFAQGVTVLEQAYEAGPTSKEKLLQQFIGQIITVRRDEFAEEKKIRLLTAGPDIIGEMEETGEIVINPSGDIILPQAKGGIQLHPTISCRIEPTHLSGEIELYYLVSGIGWEANYRAEIAEGRILLDGWMTIVNNAGADFANSNLKAVAGIMNRGRNNFAAMENELSRMESFQGQPQGNGFSDVQAYKIGKEFSISDGQTKQLKFLQTHDLDFQRIYRIANRAENASIQLQFGIGDEQGITVPLPKGTIKFYEKDEMGDLEFIGEDQIGHSAAGVKITVKLGETFSLTSKAREKSRKIIDGSEYVTFEYVIKNKQQKNAAVLIEHIVDDQLWEMESSTHDYEVLNSHSLEFHVRIAAGKSVELEFTYQVHKQKAEILRD